jgi:uncharacterized protein (DUF433 family)
MKQQLFYRIAPAVAKTHITRTARDVREHPCYSIGDAAVFLGIPKSTLKTWIAGVPYKKNGHTLRSKPLIYPADPQRSLLSFYNLVEAHVLVSTRRRKVPMGKVRLAVEWAQESLGGKHPLASYKFATIGKSIFVKKMENKKPSVVNATRFGQPALDKILDKYLKGIKRGAFDKLPIEIQPLKPKTLTASPFVINPYISSGKPVIKSTGIVASTVWNRANSGETIPDLAHDYGIDQSEIQKVIKYFQAIA